MLIYDSTLAVKKILKKRSLIRNTKTDTLDIRKLTYGSTNAAKENTEEMITGT